MSFLSKSGTQMYKRKIKSKYNFILKEIENTNAILETITSEIDEKVGMFLKGDDDSLAAHFTEIDQDLEAFHNKLCLIQDALEDGKLSIENDIACSLSGRNREMAPDTQTGSSGIPRTGGDLEQVEPVSSSSSQNDQTCYGKNGFLGQLSSQHLSSSKKVINAKLGAYATESNIAAAPCNEPHLRSIALASNISSLQNNVKISTVHNIKETNIERSEFPPNDKSSSVMEHVSSSDGSSVYGTISSACSEVLTVDKSETVASKDFVKQVHDGASSFKENRGDCHPVISSEASKWNSVEDTLRTHSAGNSLTVNIPYPDLEIGSHITAAVQVITSPSDFWIQMDSVHTKELCPIANPEFCDRLLAVKKNVYCLAPFKRPGEYFRAKIMELNEKGKQRAKVLYVDLGCKGTLDPSTLKVLPTSLQRIPSVAVHCALHGVVPVNRKWSYKAIEEFTKTIEVSDIKIIVCSRVNDIYFVQVSITADIPGNEMFTYDMADMLCQFSFAVRENKVANVHHHAVLHPESMASMSSNSTVKLPSPSSQSNNLSSMNNDENFMPTKNESPSSNVPHDHSMLNYNFQQEVHNKESNKRSVVVNKEGDRSVVGRFGTQSGQVKITNISNHQNDAETNLCGDTVIESNSPENKRFQPYETKNLVSSSLVSATDSCTANHSVNSPVDNLPCVTNVSCNAQKVTQGGSDVFDWYVNIPFPSQKFEKKAKFIVMLSAIISPSDFYVNFAMPNSTELDDLQEHMLSVYQNLDTSNMVLPSIDKLCGMFCCCQFAEDKNWYRVQVLELCNPMESMQNSDMRVRVQYVDYGNETEVNIKDLIPLKKEFVIHPAFSFHCSLAGIKPKLPESSCDNDEDNNWSTEAISRFKCLTSFEKCYTAEIADTVIYDKRKTPLPIYLWDTVSAKDILINAILVEQGAADGSDLELLYSPAEDNMQDIDNWDPMAADYHSMLNSYGVNINDPEVATVGYNSTIDKEPIEFLGESVPLPVVDSTVFVLVSAMFNPGHFFVVFPFGTKSMESLQSEIRRCIHKEEDIITEFLENMNKYYNRSLHRKENTALAPACGDLVAVKWKKDGRWYRGRVCDVLDATAPILTFFLDFGNCEVIERANVRELELQFRHFPFQAVECRLYGTEPKSSEEGQMWSNESKAKFQEITECKILVARIKSIYGSSLHVELFTCSKDEEFSISEYLVRNGYGQSVQMVSCNNSMSSQSSQKDRQNKCVFSPA